jgi:hypothetical protein
LFPTSSATREPRSRRVSPILPSQRRTHICASLPHKSHSQTSPILTLSFFPFPSHPIIHLHPHTHPPPPSPNSQHSPPTPAPMLFYHLDFFLPCHAARSLVPPALELVFCQIYKLRSVVFLLYCVLCPAGQSVDSAFEEWGAAEGAILGGGEPC